MYIVPARECVKSLESLSHDVLLKVVKHSNCKNDGDIEVARRYLSDLTPILRLQLAKDVEEHLQDPHYLPNYTSIYVPARQRPKFALWRIACFLPEERDKEVILLHVAFDHYSAEALQYLVSEKCNPKQFKSRSLNIRAGFAYEELPEGSLSYHKDFKVLISRFTNLAVVNLGKGCGNSILDLVGKMCKRLTKLTLSRDNSVTNDGFISIAQDQRENAFLDTIVLDCSLSRIKMLGISNLWLLPLTVRTMHCRLAQFDFAQDDIKLECPNGPTKVTHLTINWDAKPKDEHLVPSAMRVLDCADVLFPSLQRMDWKSPKMDLVTSGKVWDKVKMLDVRTVGADLKSLSECIPNIEVLRIGTVSHFQSFIQSGSFKHLKKFSFSAKHGYLSFSLFSEVITKIETFRVIYVNVAPDVASEFSDEQLSNLFNKCKHLKHLEVMELAIPRSYCSDEKLPLTQATVHLILDTCLQLKLLGNLESWSVNLGQLESVLATDQRYDALVGMELENFLDENRKKYFFD